MPPEELKTMQEYVGHVKRDVAGLGIIYEVNKPNINVMDEDLPPPPPELLQDLNRDKPIYSNITQNGDESSYVPLTQKTSNLTENLHYARPYHINDNADDDISNKMKNLGMRIDSFSSSSSNDSNQSINNNNRMDPKHSSTKGGMQFIPRNGTTYKNEGGENLLHEAMKHPAAPAGQKCENCKHVMKTGEVAISAERAGPIKLWHPRCFKCHDCEVNLVLTY